jgi:hypothetical protein
MTITDTDGTAAELAELREGNAALLDLLAAIAEGQVPFPVEADASGKTLSIFPDASGKMLSVESSRMDSISIAARVDDASVWYLRNMAAHLRAKWAQPLPYTPACQHQVDGQAGLCKLPAGHPGDKHKTRQHIRDSQGGAR